MSQSRAGTAKSNKSNKDADEDLTHLRKRNQALEADRAAFYNNSEQLKRELHDEAELLRKENRDLKKLRDDLLANKRAVTPSMSKTTSGFLTNEMKEEAFWKKKLDDLRNTYGSKRKVLLGLKDKLTEVGENKMAGPEESPLTRQIRLLENRLDKVMIKFNEAQSIRKTYEQIVKRLKEERVGYDNQLAAIERSLKGKEHDFEELLLLAHDATHAKELAQAELKKFEHKKAAVRDLRKTYLDEKKRVVEQKDEVIQRIERRERENVERGLEKQTSSNLQADFHMQEQYGASDSNANKQKLGDYEEAFRRIYEATGVSDVNEIIQKFTTQDETSKSLNDLKQEYLERIEFLNSEKTKIKNELNLLKYEGGENMSRKQLDEVESNVNNASNKCERARLKYERISRILVSAKAGIEHLVELVNKLDVYKLDGKPSITVTDETLVEAMAQCVEKLKLLYQMVENDPMAYDELRRRSEKAQAGGTGTGYRDVPFPPNLALTDKGGRQATISNIRVNLPDKEEEEVSEGEFDDDDIDADAQARVRAKFELQMKNTEKNKKEKTKKR